MFQKTAVFAFLPFLQINDHDQLVLWSILNFFDKSGYKWACQFWWCICSELFVNSKVAHPDGSVILINDNIMSSISPPFHFPLQHYDTLGLVPWHGCCRTIFLTIIVIIMSRQSESAQSSLSPPPLHMSPYRPRQGALAACYDRKKFYRLSGARSPQCVTQAALWIAELWWPGHIYLSPLLDNAYNLKIVHIFFPRIWTNMQRSFAWGYFVDMWNWSWFLGLRHKMTFFCNVFIMCNPVR